MATLNDEALNNGASFACFNCKEKDQIIEILEKELTDARKKIKSLEATTHKLVVSGGTLYGALEELAKPENYYAAADITEIDGEAEILYDCMWNGPEEELEHPWEFAAAKLKELSNGQEA